MRVSAELRNHVRHWATTHTLTPIDIDCTTAVMLKILDGKCKMKPASTVVMALLYDAVNNQPGKLLGAEIHSLIQNARGQLTPELKTYIYEQRVLAETMISRPVMKAFKAMIRDLGLFDSPALTPVSEGFNGDSTALPTEWEDTSP